MTPARIQRQRTKGWSAPPGCVNATRPGILGNPFVCDDPAEAVAAYRALVSGGTQTFEMGPGKLRFAPNAHPRTLHWAYAEWFRGTLPKLRGRDVMCWCPLHRADGSPHPCHAAVILEMANA